MPVQMKVFPKHFIFRVEFAVEDAPKRVEHIAAGSMRAVIEWMDPIAVIYSIELIYKEDGVRIIADF